MKMNKILSWSLRTATAVLLLAFALAAPIATAQVTPAWSIQTVDSVGYAWQDTSIALDSDGYPHISYWGGFISFDLKK